MTQKILSRKKTGPKPRYGEAKTMVSFRLSPDALAIIKGIASEKGISQAEVLERWSREYKDSLKLGTETKLASEVLNISRETTSKER